MPNNTVRSSECSWTNAQVMLLGRTIKGIKGWEYKETIAKEFIYGAGNEPLDIAEGEVKNEGNLKLLGFEADALNKAAQASGYKNITRVPTDSIVITIRLQKSKTDPVTTVTISGVAFTETGGAMEQGAKTREVTLPFLALNIESNYN